MKLAKLTILSAALVVASGAVARADEEDKPKTFTTRSIIQQLKPKDGESTPGGFRGVVIVPPEAQKNATGQINKQNLQSVNPKAAPDTPTEPIPAVKNAPLSLNMSVHFEFGSTALTDEAKAVLSHLGEALRSKELSGYRFLVTGHTDAVGGKAYNKALSENRAAAVRSHLIQQFGINDRRLQSIGLGEEQLLDPVRPKSGVNRRVQITNLGR